MPDSEEILMMSFKLNEPSTVYLLLICFILYYLISKFVHRIKMNLTNLLI